LGIAFDGHDVVWGGWSEGSMEEGDFRGLVIEGFNYGVLHGFMESCLLPAINQPSGGFSQLLVFA